MTGKRKRESAENTFSELKILKFADINAYLTGRFMYKCYTENVPGIFSDFFQCNSALHGFSTRQNEHLMCLLNELISFSFAYVTAM